MTVTSIRDAWAEVRKIFPTDYEYSIERSERAGYPIYYSKASGVNAWISDLGNRLEVNPPDDESATKEERRETAKRIQRLAYFYTVDYVQEMDNKKREAAAVKEMQAAATEGGEISIDYDVPFAPVWVPCLFHVLLRHRWSLRFASQ